MVILVTGANGQLGQALQSISGTFCFVFHNESVSESYPWVGWKHTVENWGKAL